MILGVDPGLAKCGWAIVRPGTGAIVELGVLLQEREAGYEVSTDRVHRTVAQASVFYDLIRKHGVESIIGEAVTLGGPVHVKLAMSVGLHLSWGVLSAIAQVRQLDLFEVGPKIWQHAIQPGRKKIKYDELEASMTKHVGPQVGAQLERIAVGNRNHALDACGIGMLLALRPSEATQIMKRREAA